MLKMYEILMKRAFIDKDFRPCPAWSFDQPDPEHNTYKTLEAARKHLRMLEKRHKNAAVFKIVKWEAKK